MTDPRSLPRVHAIVVCFHPDLDRLRNLCGRLVDGGALVWLVDNTPQSVIDPTSLPRGCRIIELRRNTGIAHAQNRGIRVAIADGAEIVVLLDQDSRVEEGFLAALVAP